MRDAKEILLCDLQISQVATLFMLFHDYFMLFLGSRLGVLTTALICLLDLMVLLMILQPLSSEKRLVDSFWGHEEPQLLWKSVELS